MQFKKSDTKSEKANKEIRYLAQNKALLIEKALAFSFPREFHISLPQCSLFIADL